MTRWLQEMAGRIWAAIACFPTISMKIPLVTKYKILVIMACCISTYFTLLNIQNTRILNSIKQISTETKRNNEDNGRFKSDSFNLETDLPWWERVNMTGCFRSNNTNESSRSELYHRAIAKHTTGCHCGYRACQKGPHQKVLSYSLFGARLDYFVGFSEILNDAQRLYPGWSVRLHIDPRGMHSFLCPLMEKYYFLYICDILNLPPPLGNLKQMNPSMDPMLWRSAPMGDKMVDRYLVRDTDSRLTEREVAAVRQWEESGRLLHVIRDHPKHNVRVMGGLFGINQPPSLTGYFNTIRLKLFTLNYNKYYISDQDFLSYILPAELYLNSTMHDSFNCLKFPGSIPFPTQRVGGDFVGSASYRFNHRYATVPQPCPAACRPADHQDWLYC